jgi:transcriptional regulator with AAA-type ATPase domain
LRERREDIPLLMNYFLHRYVRLHGRTVHGFTARAVKALLNYDFPGNIRELQNLVERGVISAEEGGVIDVPHMLRREQLRDAAMYSVDAAGTLASGQLAASVADAPAAPASLLDRLTDAGCASLPSLERQLMDEAVARSGGNLAAAARLLGLTRAQLAYRLKAARSSS